MAYTITIFPNGQPLPERGKEFCLIKDAGAHIIDKPSTFIDNLVCVLHENGQELAIYCFSEGEMQYWLENSNSSTVWMVVPGAVTLAKNTYPSMDKLPINS